jgi:hypothetical protein
MKFKPWSLLILVIVVASFGCKSKKKDQQPAEPPYIAPAIPFDVPEGTAALFRIQPKAFDQSVNFLTTSGGKSLIDLPENKPPHSLLLGSLLSVNGSANVPNLVISKDALFPGLDTERSAMLAISVAGNEEMLRHLELNSPSDLPKDIPSGFFMRLYLPSKTPDQLAGWVESKCDELKFACDQDFHVNAGETHVLVDYRVRNMKASLVAKDPDETKREMKTPTPAPDTTFIDQGTTALQAFTANETAFGLYLRSERLADLGALTGITEAFEALDKATPENRVLLYQRGRELAGLVYQMLSSTAREVNDSALLVRDGESSLQFDAVLGYTEHGQTISKSIEKRGELSTVSGGSMITMDLNPQWSSASDRARVPEWLEISNNDERDHAVEMMRVGGIWSYLIAGHNYPYGFAKGSENLAPSTDMKIDSIRAALDIVPSTEGSAPNKLGLRGGIVFGLGPNTDPQKAETFLSYTFKAMYNFPAVVESSGDKGNAEVRVLFGDAKVGEPAPIGPNGLGQIDLSQLADMLGGMGAPPELTGVLNTLERVRYRNARTGNASHHQMRIGKGDFSNLIIAKIPVTRAPAARRPECLTELIKASYATRGSTTRGDFLEWEIMSEMIEKLEVAEEQTCTEAAEDIRAMRARWTQWMAIYRLRNFELSVAASMLNDACRLGATTSCELVEELPALTNAITPTQISTSLEPRGNGGFRDAAVIFSSNGFSRLRGVGVHLIEPNENFSLEGFDWQEPEAQKRLAGFLSLSGQPRVLVHPLVEAKYVALLANFTSVPGGKRLARELTLLRRELVLRAVVRDASKRSVTIPFHPMGEKEAELHIKLGADGMSLISNGKMVPPIKGCKKVTICPEDNLAKLLIAASSATDETRDEALSKVIDALQMQMIDEVLNPEKTPTTILISVDETVPFVVLAELAAIIQSKTQHEVRFELGSEWVDKLSK